MDIPIVDGVTRKKPMSDYTQSTPTYGPIRLEFEPPIRGERVEDDKTIKESWGVRDTPFKVEMDFKDVGSKSIGSITDTVIEKEMVRLDLRGGLKIAKVGTTELPCDFERDGVLYYSDDELAVPGTLICNFQSTVFSGSGYDEPETTANIWAEFNYTYRYTKSQEFEIQPRGE
jgi:hypothetical protein